MREWWSRLEVGGDFELGCVFVVESAQVNQALIIQQIELTSGGSDSKLVREPGIAGYEAKLCNLTVMGGHKVVSDLRRGEHPPETHKAR